MSINAVPNQTKIPFLLRPIFHLPLSLPTHFPSSSSSSSSSSNLILKEMGAVLKLLDAILFLFFLLIAMVAPLIDAQTILPLSYFPDFLVELKAKYAQDYGDYLVSDKPHFFVGLVWFELLFQWPLALLNLFAILTSKPWFNTTCLIYGVSVSTSMVAILSELTGSNKASDKLLTMYYPFLGFGVVATLRGLLAHSSKSASSHSKRAALARMKRA
ncbi:hypothetical protein RIF29_31574 [Crotalaria pallida]|uniref:EXPERA domain-containing protein n=1 Tax=Crotalaria pallida TaxID=3830 RepID=A0AAN9EHD3_CROPI